MDYGLINGIQTGATNVAPKQYTQVYQATHKGEDYLPFMNRSFISFSFGGKNIEDFNLIAVIEGNRLERKGYSEFEDLTSSYDVLDGQFYWGTHYLNNTLQLDLATDAITQNELDNFLSWFSAGQTRELILSEHPNRAIQARVKNTPELHLLPFEKKTIKKIAGQTFKTSTTLYKGEITLTLVMDEPFWYSKVNIFGYLDTNTGIYHDEWTDANGNKHRNIFEDPDAIKIALEDNIPIGSMIQSAMLLGDNNYANTQGNNSAQIAPLENYSSSEFNTAPEYSRIADADVPFYTFGARISGATMSQSEGINTFNANSMYYFYYAGNAPSQPIIEFTLTPIINSQGYISNPKNSYTDLDQPYNVFSFESVNKKELQFTTPGVYTGYNQAIKIFRSIDNDIAWADVRKQIRDFVNHSAARAWANKVIDSFTNTTVNAGDKQTAINRMKYFITSLDNNSLLKAKFTINSKTGRAIGKIQYRIPNSSVPSSSGWLSYGIINNQEEDVGDMIRSNYLIIEDQNFPTEDGYIVAWESSTEVTRRHSHVIKHNVVNGLENVFIKYNNMYL